MNGLRDVPRSWLWLACATAIWRSMLAARTPVPSEDAASYLWMAQRFAAGDWAAGFGEVFPPLLSLLVAPWIAVGVDAVLAGQLVGALGAALAVFPVAALAERLRPGAGVAAAALLATGSLLARNAAEVYSESPFLLAAAMALWAGGAGRWWLAGLCCGLAVWLRPEGLLLPVALLIGHRRPALRALPVFAALWLLLPACRWALGHAPTLVDKLAFHAERNELSDRGDWFGNALRAPAAFLEAFGPAAILLPLACWRRSPAEARAARGLWGWLVLDVLAVCSFVVRRRFFLSAAAAVLPLLAAGLQRLPARLRGVVLAVLCVAGMADGWFSITEPDRLAEKLVGQHLARRLGPGDLVAGDLQRVLFFAGVRPPPPRRWSADELVAHARPPAVRFVVLAGRRPTAAPVEAALADAFTPYVLPARLQEVAAARGVIVLVRR